MAREISRRLLVAGGLGLGLGVGVYRFWPAAEGASQTAAETVVPQTLADAARAARAANSLLTFPSPKLPPYVDQLPIPSTVHGDRTLAIGASNHRFHRDLASAPTWSYGGAPYLGPTIEAEAGEPLHVTFPNQLGKHLLAADIDPTLDGVSEATRVQVPVSVHLHGAVASPEMDGHPMDVYLPGSAKTYRFDNRQEAANLWYHDHAMGITRLNVFAGLAGMYLLRDRFDTGRKANAWQLPSGEFEFPLILADRRFHQDGSLNFRTLRIVPQGSWDPGQIGDQMTVNGIVSPHHHVARGFYRFRVLNASNFRAYHLFFSNRMPFWVIGNDGGLLDAPVRTKSLEIASGERVDLVVDFSALRKGELVELTNDLQEAAAIQLLSGAKPLPHLVRFIGTGARGHTTPPPTRLRGGPRQPKKLPLAPKPQRRRVLTLTQDLRLDRWPPQGMSLNNLAFHDDPIETPRQGTTELWEIVNLTVEDHPIHLHLVNLRLVNRQSFDLVAYSLINPRPAMGARWAPAPDRFLTGRPEAPHPWEAGLKDTVVCPANMVTRFVVRFPTADELGFDPDATFAPYQDLQQKPGPAGSHPGNGQHGHDGGQPGDGPGHSAHGGGERLQGYVWHCHILDHEDDCMMARYRLVK
jgi:spore coat protein A